MINLLIFASSWRTWTVENECRGEVTVEAVYVILAKKILMYFETESVYGMPMPQGKLVLKV